MRVYELLRHRLTRRLRGTSFTIEDRVSSGRVYLYTHVSSFIYSDATTRVCRISYIVTTYH